MMRMMYSWPLLLLPLLVLLTAPLVVVPFAPSLLLTEALAPRQNVARSITSRTNRATPGVAAVRRRTTTRMMRMRPAASATSTTYRKAAFSSDPELHQEAEGPASCWDVGEADPGCPSSPHQRQFFTRRDALTMSSSIVGVVSSSSLMCGAGGASVAVAEDATDTSSSSSPEITDRIYLEIKGLPPAAAASLSSSTAKEDAPAPTNNNNNAPPARIVIGLYGKEAPQSVTRLRQLVSRQGLPVPCRPKAERALQKEQLEANKVYNSCMESISSGSSSGVTLLYSTIWRIVPDRRIDVGAVAGRFVAREYPDWQETAVAKLRYDDAPGTVSVRRGNTSGFGFTIYPGSSDNNKAAATLGDDEYDDYIVVGRVLQGMDVVQALNTKVPVIATSSSVNYMGLTGGSGGKKNAPDRSCRYGGPMYCNENKPLVKLTVTDAGVL